jgi:hypothetical protein
MKSLSATTMLKANVASKTRRNEVFICEDIIERNWVDVKKYK